jgi:hypothetical protein
MRSLDDLLRAVARSTLAIATALATGAGAEPVGPATVPAHANPGAAAPHASPPQLASGLRLAQVRPPSQPSRVKLGPPPPLLLSPWPDRTVYLSAPASTSLAFTWLAGTGSPTPTHYTVCVTEANRTCAEPGAAIYPAAGQAPITGTTYVARLPASFQGKRLQWSVSACGPSVPRTFTLVPLETCTPSEVRPLTWALPAPTLVTPPNNTAVTPRPTFAFKEAVAGAERYLFCVSRLLATPGFVCPQEPTINADTVVVEVRGQTEFTAQSDLTQFDNQAVGWTAAACNAALGCAYQPAHRGVVFSAPRANVACSTFPAAIQVRNARYVAAIPRSGGDLTVTRVTPAGSADGIALRGNGFGLGFYSPLPPSVTHQDLTDVQVTLDACHSFYARVTVSGRLVFPDLATFVVRRTYEFTRSANLYVQLEIRLERAFGPVRVLPETSAQIWSLAWSFLTDTRSAVSTTTDDFLVQMPDGPLGGLNSSLAGHQARSPLLRIGTTGGWSRRVVADGKLRDGHPAILTGSLLLLSNSVVSIDSTTPLDFSGHGHFSTFQFYPTFGLWTKDHWFNDWNAYKYSMGNLAPINRTDSRRQVEDALVRQTMFQMDRLTLDEGWWKNFAWAGTARGRLTAYPRGDRGATHGRSFPVLIYVWAHLTLRRTADGWVHIPGDADLIYRQLQKAGPFLVESDPAPNLADRMASGLPYIAYSAYHRERLGGAEPTRRIINVHSENMQFAWLMREAAALARDQTAERKWADIVTRYYPASKELFRALYPARNLDDPRTFYRGLIGYSPFQFEPKMPYIDITFSGMGAGYLDAGEYEPEFADVVEWAARENTHPFDDAEFREAKDPSYDPVNSWTHSPYGARLTRVFPPALAFLRSMEASTCPDLPRPVVPEYWGPVMSADLSTASLQEVLEYDHGQPTKVHKPADVISERRGRKWIRTNTEFQTYWAPGFWQRVDPASVPANRQFDVVATLPPAPSCVGTHYSASWSGNQILVMTDYSGGALALDLPPTTVVRSVMRRAYRASTARWDPAVVAPGTSVTQGPGGKLRLQLGPPERKALLIIDVTP